MHRSALRFLKPRSSAVAKPARSSTSAIATTSTGRITAATRRMFTLDEVMDLTSGKRQMLVLAILTNLEGLGVSLIVIVPKMK